MISGDDAPRVDVTQDALSKAEKFIEEDEGAVNRLRRGFWATAITVLAVAMSLFHLASAYSVFLPQVVRGVHVGGVIALAFLLFPALPRLRDRVMWYDVAFAILAVACVGHIFVDFDDFIDRAVIPEPRDIFFGVALILLVLEAVRRTSGWVMLSVVAIFLVYALVGPWLPEPWTHRSYSVSRLVGQLYMTTEGIFGTAIDVSSSYIILFTIFGAVLQASGAGKFFIDFAFAAMGGRASRAGKAIVLSSFLLGGPSGSSTATTVMMGAVAYPMLARAGYGRNAAGGLLAAGGIGAILSPPVLGAAAFLIAEFLKISYFDVVIMATIPTALYYLSLYILVSIDARRFGTPDVVAAHFESAWTLTKRYGFHFLSLVSIIVFMVFGFTPITAVFWATIVAIAFSFCSREGALYPMRLIQALREGTVGVLGVASTCAGAGIIIGVVTLTGLGLKFSSIILDYAGGNIFLTALYTALVVWIVGLAVPVTASYIICAVIAAPALIKAGVPDFAAHMFIFYYAVLAEVSPPTALAPFAAAAITGGSPYLTTAQAWKYTLPVFVVPFTFVLEPLGIGLLLKGGMEQVILVCGASAVGIAALASGLQGWLFAPTSRIERLGLLLGGIVLMYPTSTSYAAGGAILVTTLAAHTLRTRREPAAIGAPADRAAR